MAKSLSERLASAKASSRITITDLEALIADLEAERASQAATFERCSAESIDFALSGPDRDRAAQVAERARRDVTALAIEIDALGEVLAEKRAKAEESVLAAERKAALAERDALAETIAARYGLATDLLIELAKEILASDTRLSACGLGKELSAEAMARECNNAFRRQMEPITRLTQIRLPALREIGDVWPPREKFFDFGELRRVPPPTPEQIAEKKVKEDARWSRFKVEPKHWPGSPIGPIKHRGGIYLFTHMHAAELDLDANCVASARALKLSVTPIEAVA